MSRGWAQINVPYPSAWTTSKIFLNDRGRGESIVARVPEGEDPYVAYYCHNRPAATPAEHQALQEEERRLATETRIK